MEEDFNLEGFLKPIHDQITEKISQISIQLKQKDCEKKFLFKQIDELTAEVISLKEKNANLENQEEQSKKELEKMEVTMKEQRETIKKLKEENKKLGGEKEEYKKQCDIANAKIDNKYKLKMKCNHTMAAAHALICIACYNSR